MAAVAGVPVACTYLKYAGMQREYERLQAADPSQRNLKHMIDRPNFAVVGRTVDVDGIGAAMDQGVLSVTLAKVPEVQPVRKLIEVA